MVIKDCIESISTINAYHVRHDSRHELRYEIFLVQLKKQTFLLIGINVILVFEFCKKFLGAGFNFVILSTSSVE